MNWLDLYSIFFKDAKSRWMTQNIYNMLGEVIYTYNIDSGRRWLLNDVAGKPIRLPIAIGRDNQHRQMEFTYDGMQRPTNTSLRLSGLAVIILCALGLS